MIPKVSVFIATSLDGYIARSNGDIDWLDAANAKVPKGEDCGYGALMRSVDVLVMGRNSYEKVRSFSFWPYGDVPVVVMSSKPITFSDELPKTLQQSSESPRELCERLSGEGVAHIYVDGGNTIQRFLAARLVHELTITVIPVILGEGIPLFGPTGSDVLLTFVGAKAYEFGFVQLKYTVQNNA
ncbi:MULTISPECIES: dihydrofolate reductase family protein [Synechocystis]|uniref:Dihydrofolate reductase n=1 Tax=Synechocystis salina LEGE 00031 TaxID=1828736 RepID=A0ABR9VRY2_9SYNC|nr:MULTISPECIES: dihydrofolate reductase family protein [Synechocystis]MBE9193851.1 dihydrofolate reductase [Synechocystis sp. LEGE 06083]MBE9241690.1 dihydrofolate reductase [Synechocystis salina LEGE 00041]MBE9254116.1 dihydrofolate reductase [Synechocystis salina LEGE 00031]